MISRPVYGREIFRVISVLTIEARALDPEYIIHTKQAIPGNHFAMSALQQNTS